MQSSARTRFTLLAISKLYNTRINLVGVCDNKQWIRPMPMYLSDLYSKEGGVFQIFGVIEMNLNDWWGVAPRPEDRFFSRVDHQPPNLIKVLSDAEKVKHLRTVVDHSVDSIFSRGRTVGLIKPVVKDVNFRRNPYNPTEFEARMVFEDSSRRTSHNWMTTDLLWHKKFMLNIRDKPGSLSAKLREARDLLNSEESYFVIGLTKVFIEHPGPYGGCWPQVLGVITL
jgi:hypothetical protein